MVVLVRLQMCSQIVDSLCQNGDLYFRRTGIVLVGTVFLGSQFFLLSATFSFTSFSIIMHIEKGR